MKSLRLRSVRSLSTVLFAAAGFVALTGCTPEQIALFNQVTSPYQDTVTDQQLASLRHCESTDNYAAVSASGRYRGAYQFSQSTWNRVAASHFPWLVDTDPATVEPWWQDAMARALWSESGASSWPQCGRNL
jgi:muramidase (phage lysozyme)